MSEDKSNTTTSRLHKAILYSSEQVDLAIEKIAEQIVDKYDSESTLFVGLLNGATPFASKLMFAIQARNPNYHPNLQMMIISRYGKSRQGGQPALVTDLPPEYRDLTGKKVVVLDDLLDGGDTFRFARKHLLGYGAKSVDIAVLVRKAKTPPAPIEGEIIIGIDKAPDAWLSGMGMDDNRIAGEANRWAPYVAEAMPSGSDS